MTYQNLLVEDQEGIRIITINRPDKMNALNISLLKELKEIITGIQNDKNLIGVIITGAGNKALAAGADIAEFAEFTADEAIKMSRNGHEIMNSIENLHIPVIAAVNGFALGGGCELSMACHMRVASENAKFGQPEVNLGIIAGYGGTQRLVQLIGKGKAMELLLTADMINAEEAYRLGLVNHVTTSENLIDKCKEIIKKIAQKGPNAIARTITCVNAVYSHENGFDLEIEQFGKCFGTPEFKEGTQAFVNKRKAEFTRN